MEIALWQMRPSGRHPFLLLCRFLNYKTGQEGRCVQYCRIRSRRRLTP